MKITSFLYLIAIFCTTSYAREQNAIKKEMQELSQTLESLAPLIETGTPMLYKKNQTAIRSKLLKLNEKSSSIKGHISKDDRLALLLSEVLAQNFNDLNVLYEAQKYRDVTRLFDMINKTCQDCHKIKGVKRKK